MVHKHNKIMKSKYFICIFYYYTLKTYFLGRIQYSINVVPNDVQIINILKILYFYKTNLLLKKKLKTS